ncbi:polyamine ABC transporter substrate-binding protein [Clostridium oryzae]|uniref:Spermidine/putrescine-binding periplasmic protein n=1 Tax=Clostridium oryzae TaxID=1450648 RepID=A0A1V4I8D3_9CLOT|nr:spermidine/putrescine ABC transporter substrate-binding protein [Clostridium oryzae]OPJ56183.1 spermidine/putrescine-binding periplasmic protein precursor [Clostridium oryzae]
MLKKSTKILSLLTTVIISASLFAGCSKSSKPKGEEKVLNLYTWANYVPDNVIKEFKKETGIKVNFTNFSTNEEMLSKLQAANGGQYDVIICADYIIKLMSNQDNVLMKQIDKSKIYNFKNLDKTYLNQNFDKDNKYSVPYTMGSQMIVYDPSKVKVPIQSFKDLWNSKLKDSLVLLDDPRSVIGMALKKLGYSINETDKTKLDQAKAELAKLKPNVKVFDADTPHNSLINGDTTVGVMWGSQASAALKGKKGLEIVYPTDGMTVEEDNFIMPVKAPHANNAYKFINFMLNGKISDMATEQTEYVNTTTAAKKYMSKEYLNNKAVFIPTAEMKKTEHIEDVGSASKIYDQIWSEFKQQ